MFGIQTLELPRTTVLTYIMKAKHVRAICYVLQVNVSSNGTPNLRREKLPNRNWPRPCPGLV
eukprot:16161031-Heterocapsa_arctica.AAC.1